MTAKDVDIVPAATKKEISDWFDEGIRKGATHLAVICDTYDWDDFPRYVMPGQDPHKVCDGSNMEKLMEVYALHLSKEVQLNEHRAFHYETAEGKS